MKQIFICISVFHVVLMSFVVVPGYSQEIFFPVSGFERSGSSLGVAANHNDAQCRIKDGLIYYKGVCSRLLKACDDNDNQWLVLDRQGTPTCRNRPCPQGELRHRGRCIIPTNPTVCGRGEILYVEFTGATHCDCEMNLIYDTGIGRCLPEHRQGSCPNGQVLELSGRNIVCVDINCPTDDLVYNPNDKTCYKKTYQGACAKSKGLSLTFHKDNNTAACAGSAALRNILEVPALTACPAGSKRDPLGMCQSVFRTDSSLSFRVATQHTSRYTVCPPSYARLPNGVCRKNNTLFTG